MLLNWLTDGTSLISLKQNSDRTDGPIFPRYCLTMPGSGCTVACRGHSKNLMDFGLFYSMAINVDMGEQVKSIPHHNVMNLAFGVCAIMAFGTLCILSTNLVADIIFDAGFFPDGIITWLINHLYKFPPLFFTSAFHPSSLITILILMVHLGNNRHNKAITQPF